jgi:aryl-alcohol dehydrogenase-like predicted oxidoreductase
VLQQQRGQTGTTMSRLGFGTWPIGGTLAKDDYGAVDDHRAVRAIRRALDLGITLFDTAPSYGQGRAETILGRALGDRRHESIVVSKCGNRWDPESRQWIHSSRRSSIMKSVDGSLRRLGTDYLDLLLIHVPDPDVAPAEAMETLRRLRDSGKARAVGLSNFSLEQILAYREHGRIDAIQVGYGLFDRRLERTLLPEAAQQGLSVMVYGALAFGLLSGTWRAPIVFGPDDWRARGGAMGLPLFTAEHLPPNLQVVDALRALAARRGLTVAQLAIAWVLANAAVDVVLVGIREPKEVNEDLRAGAASLSPDDFLQIETIMLGARGVGLPDAHWARSVTGEAFSAGVIA